MQKLLAALLAAVIAFGATACVVEDDNPDEVEVEGGGDAGGGGGEDAEADAEAEVEVTS